MASMTAGRAVNKHQSVTTQSSGINNTSKPEQYELFTDSFKTNNKMVKARRWQLKVLCLILIIFVIASYLPRPIWLSCDPGSNDSPVINPDLSISSKAKLLTQIIDPNTRGVVRMFHIYNETQTEIRRAYHQHKLSRKELDESFPQAIPKLRILPSTIEQLPIHLQLISARERQNLFGGQGRKPINQSTNSYSSRQQPECVQFLGPQEMKSPKICIHPPETDKVISMFLRSSGHWELDHVIDMEWALQAYTDMQLVDLGCNVGVFTLYAAGMGRHVIAVDVLPSNLRLLQTSLTLNDLENQNYVIRFNTSHLYPRRSVTKSSSTMIARTRNIDGSQVGAVVRLEDKRESENSKKADGLDNKFQGELSDLNEMFHQRESNPKLSRKRSRQTKSRKSRALHLKTKREAISHEKELPVKRGSNNADDDFLTGILSKNNKTEILDSHKRKFKNIAPSSWSTPGHSSSPAPQLESLRLSQLVTIVHNAIYRDRITRLGVHVQKDGNVGGSDVLSEDSPLLDEQRKAQSLVLVDTVCLDDLLPLLKAPSVYLKMDIEGSEPQALECAQKFFEKVHVRYVLMEWLFQLRSVGSSHSAAPGMIRFLTAKGFIPTRGTGVDVRGGAGDDRGVSVLDVNSWDRWPEMVLWMER